MAISSLTKANKSNLLRHTKCSSCLEIWRHIKMVSRIWGDCILGTLFLLTHPGLWVMMIVLGAMPEWMSPQYTFIELRYS